MDMAIDLVGDNFGCMGSILQPASLIVLRCREDLIFEVHVYSVTHALSHSCSVVSVGCKPQYSRSLPEADAGKPIALP